MRTAVALGPALSVRHLVRVWSPCGCPSPGRRAREAVGGARHCGAGREVRWEPEV